MSILTYKIIISFKYKNISLTKKDLYLIYKLTFVYVDYFINIVLILK